MLFIANKQTAWTTSWILPNWTFYKIAARLAWERPNNTRKASLKNTASCRIVCLRATLIKTSKPCWARKKTNSIVYRVLRGVCLKTSPNIPAHSRFKPLAAAGKARLAPALCAEAAVRPYAPTAFVPELSQSRVKGPQAPCGG